MSYTIQDYQKDYVRDHLNLLSLDDVLKRYSADDILAHLSPDVIQLLMQKIEQKNDGTKIVKMAAPLPPH